jgi:hypothetical protein
MIVLVLDSLSAAIAVTILFGFRDHSSVSPKPVVEQARVNVRGSTRAYWWADR